MENLRNFTHATQSAQARLQLSDAIRLNFFGGFEATFIFKLSALNYPKQMRFAVVMVRFGAKPEEVSSSRPSPFAIFQ